MKQCILYFAWLAAVLGKKMQASQHASTSVLAELLDGSWKQSSAVSVEHVVDWFEQTVRTAAGNDGVVVVAGLDAVDPCTNVGYITETFAHLDGKSASFVCRACHASCGKNCYGSSAEQCLQSESVPKEMDADSVPDAVPSFRTALLSYMESSALDSVTDGMTEEVMAEIEADMQDCIANMTCSVSSQDGPKTEEQANLSSATAEVLDLTIGQGSGQLPSMSDVPPTMERVMEDAVGEVCSSCVTPVLAKRFRSAVEEGGESIVEFDPERRASKQHRAHFADNVDSLASTGLAEKSVESTSSESEEQNQQENEGETEEDGSTGVGEESLFSNSSASLLSRTKQRGSSKVKAIDVESLRKHRLEALQVKDDFALQDIKEDVWANASSFTKWRDLLTKIGKVFDGNKELYGEGNEHIGKAMKSWSRQNFKYLSNKAFSKYNGKAADLRELQADLDGNEECSQAVEVFMTASKEMFTCVDDWVDLLQGPVCYLPGEYGHVRTFFKNLNDAVTISYGIMDVLSRLRIPYVSTGFQVLVGALKWPKEKIGKVFDFVKSLLAKPWMKENTWQVQYARPACCPPGPVDPIQYAECYGPGLSASYYRGGKGLTTWEKCGDCTFGGAKGSDNWGKPVCLLNYACNTLKNFKVKLNSFRKLLAEPILALFINAASGTSAESTGTNQDSFLRCAGVRTCKDLKNLADNYKRAAHSVGGPGKGLCTIKVPSFDMPPSLMSNLERVNQFMGSIASVAREVESFMMHQRCANYPTVVTKHRKDCYDKTHCVDKWERRRRPWSNRRRGDRRRRNGHRWCTRIRVCADIYWLEARTDKYCFTVKKVLDGIAGFLSAIFGPIMSAIKKAIDVLLKPLKDFVGKIFDFVDVVTGIFPSIQDVLNFMGIPLADMEWPLEIGMDGKSLEQCLKR